jgi:hypothetical protein
VAIVVVVVVAVLVVAGFGVLAWFTANERFTCPGVAWSIDYIGASSGYFDAHPPTGCLGYPLAGSMGYEVAILVNLTNNDQSVSHQISSITALYPSSMNSISPPLPITVSPGGTANVTLNVTIPTLTGDYVLHGVITTS